MDQKQLQLLLFRNELKQKFPLLPHIHHQFVHFLAMYNMKEVDEPQLIISVELLLHGHDDLICQFKAIFEKHTISDFIFKVEQRFINQPEILQRFIAILRYSTHCEADDTYAQIAALFVDHPDLMHEFDLTLRRRRAKEEPPEPARDSKWVNGVLLDSPRSGLRAWSAPSLPKRTFPILGICRRRPSSWAPGGISNKKINNSPSPGQSVSTSSIF